MQLIISMAGMSRRFTEAGYNKPKYEIVARTRPLFQWSLLSLRAWIKPSNHFLFITLKDHQCIYFLKRNCEILGISNYTIHELQAGTDGQATTVVEAGESIPNHEERMLIFNIDTFIHPDSLNEVVSREFPNIPVFKAEGSHWSFVEVDSNKMAIRTAEKKRISKMASVGLYEFYSFSEFLKAYGDTYMGNSENKVFKERYIAPMYNSLIDKGKKYFVPMLERETVFPLGTPEELKSFEGSRFVPFE